MFGTVSLAIGIEIGRTKIIQNHAGAKDQQGTSKTGHIENFSVVINHPVDGPRRSHGAVRFGEAQQPQDSQISQAGQCNGARGPKVAAEEGCQKEGKSCDRINEGRGGQDVMISPPEGSLIAMFCFFRTDFETRQIFQ